MPLQSSGRAGRPRLGSEDKRARILREAFDLFARRGYSATSLTEIARAAEISKPGLLHHFGSKEALFSAVLEQRDAGDRAHLEDAADDVWSLLDRWVHLMTGNAARPGLVGLYTAMSAGSVDAAHPAHPWLHRHLVDGVEALSERFDRGKAAGVVADDAPSIELARTVLALSDGIQVQWLCARSDSGTEHPTEDATTPTHGVGPVDMTAQMRLLVDMIRARWATGVAAASPPAATT